MIVVVNKRYWHPIFGWGKFKQIKKNVTKGLFVYEGDPIEIYLPGSGYITQHNPVIVPMSEVFKEETKELDKEWGLRIMAANPTRIK